MSEIVNVDFNEKKGAFTIVSAGKKIAEMTFVFAGADKIIIDHTEVHPSFEGKGVGKQLIEKAVAFAREKSIKIVSVCSFAKHVLEKNPIYKDVL